MEKAQTETAQAIHKKQQPIPVTILTGFLGSGKTTLLNRILNEKHGQRIAVIENEFGEVGIDNDLVTNVEEEIFEMNNGCLCCTVRGDLIRILGDLLERRHTFDRVLIETTGMADPGPVVQTFFVDEKLSKEFFIDGIVTIVDSKHVVLHIDTSDEVKKQIAFADVILLNKTDLVFAKELDMLEERIRSMNGLSKIYRTEQSNIALEKVLLIGGFDLESALKKDPQFLDIEYEFEWAGIYTTLPSIHQPIEIVGHNGPDDSIKIFTMDVQREETNWDDWTKHAQAKMQNQLKIAEPHIPMECGKHAYVLDTRFESFKYFAEPRPHFAIFTQHLPDEFGLKLVQNGKKLKPLQQKKFRGAHEHESDVGSVGFEVKGTFLISLLQFWLSEFINQHGNQLYRYKGVLSIDSQPHKIIIQGVHMLMEVVQGEKWKEEEEKVSKIVFIGQNLDRYSIENGLRQCLAQ